MRDIATAAVRGARLVLLLVVVVGLQPVSTDLAPAQTSSSHVSPAALLAGPAVSLPVSGIEQQSGDGEGRAPADACDALAGEQEGRANAPSACSAGLCPWRASDALARAGRRSSPSTAPPTSPV